MKNLILDPQPHRDYAIYSCIKLKAIEDCIRSGKRSTFHYRIENVINDSNSHYENTTVVLQPGKLGDLGNITSNSPIFTPWEGNNFGIKNFHRNNLPKIYKFARKRGTYNIMLRCWFFICRKIR